MAEKRDLARYGPLTGIATVVFLFAGVFLSESGDAPDEDSTAEDILAYFQDDTTTILTGAVLFVAGGLFLIWFLSFLRRRAVASGGSSHATSLLYSTGLVGAASLMAVMAPTLAVGIAVEDADVAPQAATAEMGWHLGTGFFVIAELALAAFLVAAAVLTFRRAFFPKWLGWLLVVVAALMFIPPIGWLGLIFGFPVLLIIMSILMMRGQNGSRAAPQVTSGGS